MTADVSDAALSPPSRRGALYVAEYRLRNMWKWRGSIVAFGIGNPVLYLASVGIGVGALVDANGGGVDGVPYLVFLAPALIAAAAIQGGTDEAMFPSLHGFIWSKLFFSIRATSVTGGQIADGVLLATVVRVVFTSAAYWCVLWAFGAVGIGSALPLIAVSVLAGSAWGALILAIVAGGRAAADDGIGGGSPIAFERLPGSPGPDRWRHRAIPPRTSRGSTHRSG